MNEAIIEAENLTKDYHEQRAVDSINLSIKGGEILGLLGPNGAGKTTTLRMLSGFMAPTSGTIQIAGHKLPEDILKVREHIGFLSAGMSLYAELSVRETLTYFGKLRGFGIHQIHNRIDELVEQFKMNSFCDRRFGKLSSGEKQRSTIAATIFHKPQVLILDEITTSLDVISSQFTIQLLKKLKEEGAAILFSTHIISEAEFLCDRIALINKGRIIDLDESNKLIKKYNESNLTGAFLSAVKKTTPELVQEVSAS